MTELNLDYTPAVDLSPLKGVPLTRLFLEGTKVTELSPLKDMPLIALNLRYTPVRDISPLRGLPLKNLVLNNAPVSDIGVLSGSSLEALGLAYTKVADISALRDLPALYYVDLTLNSITDLQPLVDNPGIDAGDMVLVGSNPLSEDAINIQIPALQARGVFVDCCP